VNGLVRRWITRWQCLASYNTRLDRCVDCGSEIFSSTRVQQSEKYIYNRWKISNLLYILYFTMLPVITVHKSSLYINRSILIFHFQFFIQQKKGTGYPPLYPHTFHVCTTLLLSFFNSKSGYNIQHFALLDYNVKRCLVVGTVGNYNLMHTGNQLTIPVFIHQPQLILPNCEVDGHCTALGDTHTIKPWSQEQYQGSGNCQQQKKNNGQSNTNNTCPNNTSIGQQ
jgi:hypothetical protein